MTTIDLYWATTRPESDRLDEATVQELLPIFDIAVDVLCTKRMDWDCFLACRIIEYGDWRKRIVPASKEHVLHQLERLFDARQNSVFAREALSTLLTRFDEAFPGVFEPYKKSIVGIATLFDAKEGLVAACECFWMAYTDGEETYDFVAHHGSQDALWTQILPTVRSPAERALMETWVRKWALGHCKEELEDSRLALFVAGQPWASKELKQEVFGQQ